MPNSVFKRHYSTAKPPTGVQVDWGHPLAQGLVAAWLFYNEGTSVFDVVGGVKLPLRASASWSTSFDGPGLFSGTAGSNNGASVTATAQMKTQSPSIFWRGNFLGADSGANPRIFGIEYDNVGATAPYYCCVMYRSTNKIIAATNNGAAQTVTDTTTVPTGVMKDYAATVNSGVGTLKLYNDGVNTATLSYTAGAVSYTSTSTLICGYALDTSSSYVNAVTSFAAIWNVTLTASQVQWLHAEPYGMFSNPAQRFWSFPSVAAAPTTLPIFVQC